MSGKRTSGLDELRRVVQSMPRAVPPAELTTKLRVIASREAARRRSRVTLRHWWQSWSRDARLSINNLMRPLAIPTAGGFVSALVLFGALGISLSYRGATALANPSLTDVPTVLYTEASVKSFMPLGLQAEELIVEITVDDQGRVVEYSLPNAEQGTSQVLRRSIENHLLFTQFTPATRVGQPTLGKVRLSFRSSRIDVKG
jgi:hypothetical protein